MSTFTIILTIVLLAQSWFVIDGFNNTHCLGKQFKCGEANEINVCVNVSDYKGKIHDLQVCPEGTYCPWEGAAYGKPKNCTPSLPLNKTLPGEICLDNIDCMSGKCVNGLCQGRVEGQKCSWHGDCEAGYFCNITSYCQTQLQFEYECKNDYECSNNCACNLGKCAFFYSLENNISADNPKTCLKGYINKENNTCQTGPKSLWILKPCQLDTDCEVLNEFGDITGNAACQCGFNAGSFSYCSLSEGDQEYLDTINLFQWILYTNSKCHTLLRYGPCRFLYPDEVQNYQKALNYYKTAPQTIFNDGCIKKIYTYDYWDLSSLGPNMNMMIKIISLISLLLH